MASIDKRPNGQWRARWREYPGGPQKARHFPRKLDAERFLDGVRGDLARGTYVDPDAGRTTLGDYSKGYLERMGPTWRANTAAHVTNSLHRHVLPVLGRRPLSSIKRADVEALCTSLALSPSTVGVVAQHLSQMLSAAVEDGLIDGLIPRNPAARARLPKREPNKAQPVPLEVVDRIAAALPDWLRVAVPLGVGSGLRQGEASGLSVDRVDFLRRTLRVDRQLVTRNVPEPTLTEPKTPSSTRTIPLPRYASTLSLRTWRRSRPSRASWYSATRAAGRWTPTGSATSGVAR